MDLLAPLSHVPLIPANVATEQLVAQNQQTERVPALQAISSHGTLKDATANSRDRVSISQAGRERLAQQAGGTTIAPDHAQGAQAGQSDNGTGAVAVTIDPSTESAADTDNPESAALSGQDQVQQDEQAAESSAADEQVEQEERQQQAQEAIEKAEQQQIQEEVQQLAARDREVRTHEQAHAAVGGQFAGSPSYSYERGPDGVRYAVSGEVPIDVSPIPGDPAATLRKMQTVQAAALAPAEPSSQDRKVAAEASRLAAQARVDLQVQTSESLEASGRLNEENGSETANSAANVEAKADEGTGADSTASEPTRNGLPRGFGSYEQRGALTGSLLSAQV